MHSRESTNTNFIFDIPELLVPVMISLIGAAANNETTETRVPICSIGSYHFKRFTISTMTWLGTDHLT
jgi:hypothetical protein